MRLARLTGFSLRTTFATPRRRILFAPSLGDGKTSRQWAYSEGRGRLQFARTQRYKLYSNGKFFDLDAMQRNTDAHSRQVQDALAASD